MEKNVNISDSQNITISRKDLWLAIREKYPKCIVRSREFGEHTKERLYALLKLPKSQESDDFVCREAKYFVQNVRRRSKLNNRSMSDDTFRRFKGFFDKKIDPSSPAPPKICNDSEYTGARPSSPVEMVLRNGHETAFKTIIKYLDKTGQEDAAFMISQIYQNPEIAKTMREFVKINPLTQKPEFIGELLVKSHADFDPIDYSNETTAKSLPENFQDKNYEPAGCDPLSVSTQEIKTEVDDVYIKNELEY